MVNILIRKRVVLIDRDPELRAFYKLIINSTKKFRVVGDYYRCDDALRDLQQTRPDIALMDVDLPGMSGIEGIQGLKELFPYIEIVIITSLADYETVYDAIKAGASGYLCKQVSHNDVIQSLEEVANGGAPMSSKIARMIVDDFHVRVHP